MLNKGPLVTHSENLPPWQYKRERAPVHKDPGPALTVSTNYVDPLPCLEDGKDTIVIQTDCTEASRQTLEPLSSKVPVIAPTQSQVLEDGKSTSVVESECIQNASSAMQPQIASQQVIHQEGGPLIENVQMKKDLI